MRRTAVAGVLAVGLLLASGLAVVDIDADGVTTLTELREGTTPLVADSDGDGLDDGAELTTHATTPTVADTDGDGLTDGTEVTAYGTDPLATDTDGDGLTDGREATLNTNPLQPDTDGDGLTDTAERSQHGTDPLATDTDGDGLTDTTEVRTHRTDPTEPDSDADGIADRAELERTATNPTVADTDGDGLDDGRERARGTNPLQPDTDGDGLTDTAELLQHGTDPLATDTDGDGLTDAREVTALDTSPVNSDTDGDGLTDSTERTSYQSSPTVADTDGDGLDDGTEVTEGTDPAVADTDGDGLTDGVELATTRVTGSTDPLRKDIFIEIDSMAGLTVPQTDLTQLVAAFDNAPVANPSGEDGIRLHVFSSDSPLEQQAETTPREYYDEIVDAQFDSRGRGFWHVALVTNISADHPNGSVVGASRPNSGGMLVEHQGPDATGATLMHELGHTLGLSATLTGVDSRTLSGDEYPSAMNYNAVPACDDIYQETAPCGFDATYYGFSDGTHSPADHDDWGFIESQMNTPPTDDLNAQNATD